MTDEPLPALEYDRTPPGYVSRRRYRLMLAFAIVSVVLLVGGLLVPVTLRAWRALTSPRNITITAPTIVSTTTATPPAAAASIVTYSPPPRPDVMRFYAAELPPADQVVYEEDPIRTMKLLDARDEYAVVDTSNLSPRHRQAYQPPAFRQAPVPADQVVYFAPGHNACTLFVHERTSPGGNRRLVILYLEIGPAGEEYNEALSVRLSRRLRYKIFSVEGGSDVRETRRGDSLEVSAPPADRFPIRWVDGVLKADRAAAVGIRFFAGQPDATDPSHFTIDYEQGTRRDTVDVWLGDDDFLRIVPRGGTVKEGKWDVTGAATPVEKQK